MFCDFDRASTLKKIFRTAAMRMYDGIVYVELSQFGDVLQVGAPLGPESMHQTMSLSKENTAPNTPRGTPGCCGLFYMGIIYFSVRRHWMYECMDMHA